MASGDPDAMERLLPAVYGELKVLAASYLRRERGDHTLSPTALVHEAYLKLVDQRTVNWEGRSHFFGIAAQAMRRILVDHARRRQALKRSPESVTISLADAGDLADGEACEALKLDEALTDLERLDARQARVVELRYFGGLSVDETAAALEISPATVKREWATARAWIARRVHLRGSTP